MEKTLLEQLKDYLLELDQKRKFTRLQSNLEYAIKNLNVETVNELLESGASIELLEKEESTLGMAADAYTSNIFNTIDLYRKQKHMKLDDDLSQTSSSSKDELDSELNAQMEEETNRLLMMSEFLYQHGANINHNTYLGYVLQGGLMDVFTEKKEIKKKLQYLKEWHQESLDSVRI